MPARSQSRVFPALITLLALLPALSAAAQEAERPTPDLTLEAVEVAPETPGPDTLCQLRVEVRNSGDRTASQLHFKVAVNGQELAVYGNQLFMQAIAPGGISTVKLYNFWSTETSRPTPKNGKLEIEVTLDEAQWYSIQTKKEGDQEVEEWSPLGAVDGLPVSRSLTIEMSGVGAKG